MATTSTDSIQAGTPAPDFSLPDVVTGARRSLAELAGLKGTLIVFLCAHCPYVVHVREQLISMAAAFADRGIRTIGISANDVATYPEDSPEKLREMVLSSGIPFPVLYDESQETARAYTAACTPDFFLFDGDRRLAYRGRLDASSPKNGQPLTGDDLRRALEAVAAGAPVPAPWPPALGCGIKWKA
jgi:peroxiredoxin